MHRLIRWTLKLLGWTAIVSIPSILFSTYVWDYTLFMGLTVISVVQNVVWWAGYFKFFWKKEPCLSLRRKK